MASRLKLTRDELYRICGGDPKAVEQFEKLFSSMDEAGGNTLIDILIAAGNADATAKDALGQIAELARSVLLSTGEVKATEALGKLAEIACKLDAVALASRDCIDEEARDTANMALLEAGRASALAGESIALTVSQGQEVTFTASAGDYDAGSGTYRKVISHLSFGRSPVIGIINDTDGEYIDLDIEDTSVTTKTIVWTSPALVGKDIKVILV